MPDSEMIFVMLLAALPVVTGEVAGLLVAFVSKRMIASSLLGAAARTLVGAAVFIVGHEWLSGLVELHSIALISVFSLYLIYRATSDIRIYASRRSDRFARGFEAVPSHTDIPSA